MRFHESKAFSSTLALLDEFGNQVGFGVPGEELVLENDLAAFNLLQSSQTSGGPSAPDVTVTFVVSFAEALADKQAVARTLPATQANGGQGIAKPGNAVNAELTGNVLPDQAREIIRFQRAVEAVVALIGSGKLGQTEAIEIVFGCKRSGRADSPYARARVAVQAQIGPVGPAFPPLTPEQQQLRSQLQLDGH